MGNTDNLKEIENKYKVNKRFDVFGRLIAASGVLVTILPIMLASRYVVLAADDFSVMRIIREEPGGSLIGRLIHLMIRLYYNWSSGYGGVLTEFSLAALIDSNRAFLGVYLILALIIQLFALYLFVGAVCRYFGLADARVRFYAFCGIIISWLGYYNYAEVSFWFIGNVAYGMSLTLALLVFSLEQLSFEKKSIPLLVLNIPLAILLGGMGIQSGAVICLFMLIVNIIEIIKLRKINIWYGIPSLLTAAGYLVHLTAPGNFVRRDSMGAEGSMLGAVAASVTSSFEEILRNLRNPYLLLSLIFIFYLGLAKSRAFDHGSKALTAADRSDASNSPIYMSLGRFLINLALSFLIEMSAVVTVFMGKGTYGLDTLAPRGLYVYDFVTIIVLHYIVFILGVFCTDSGAFDKVFLGAGPDKKAGTKPGLCLALIAGVICIAFGSRLIENAAWKEITSDLVYGHIQEYNRETNALMEEIKSSKEEDLVIDKLPDCPDSFYPFMITADPDDWLNIAVAGYYGKSSIVTAP
ncbi:DUF6056 family protein [Butyrivibrio sp. MC2013]|uniref:DUF6056 family protein n=1 Tax=Butyrivibrio sp. MC2013 TaxID=1280686 RepID=UPI000424ACCB|nr:DUF6056 family protein [Butyrivibrio sp. MC2013]